MAQKEEDFSAFVSETLNSIGYKWEFIQLRREQIKTLEHGMNRKRFGNGMSFIHAGSQREGICKLFQSDSDHMHVFDEIIASENVQLFEHKGNLTVLELDMNECPPGYSLLIVRKHGGRFPATHQLGHETARIVLRQLIDSSCYISHSGVSCLSSEIFIRNMSEHIQVSDKFRYDILNFRKCPTFQSKTGPSLPAELALPVIGVTLLRDQVHAIPCHCPSIFERFLRRPRHHSWPSEDVLQELSQLEAHVVPVGYKRSPDHFIQWRICLTKAEIRLIECLTEPQIQVFILLKIFAKDVLKEVWDAMTSYIMKNVILWIVELSPGHKFHTDSLVNRFLDCLFFLKLCVRVGKLPNYMISERNLLSHDQFIVKKGKILSLLDDCIREKGCCLLRSATLEKAMTKMYRSPQSAILDGLERDQTERVMYDMADMFEHLPVLEFETCFQYIARVLISGHTCVADMMRLCIERLPDGGFDLNTVDFEQVLKQTKWISHLR